jgi:hypothetical protein
LQEIKTQTALLVSDVHIPFEDKAGVVAFKEFAGWFAPDFLFFNGDIVDFYSISRYQKDREENLQDELDNAAGFFSDMRDILPNAKMYYKLGNHEDRLNRYLLSNASALKGLRALSLSSLLGLEELNVEVVGEQGVISFGDAVITHGDRVAKRAGMTAHAMIEEFGMSGISGHTHRAGKVSRRYFDRTVTWVEQGCLCDLNPEYARGVTDWRHGFAVGTLHDGHTEFDLIPVNNGRIVYEGNLFDGN